ncbi:MAG: 3'(2'),5'-bisphosphate nucleotidase CysQ [Clostridia bacterium]|nr:3'(2'),5'-bisphosphate nucleotidase CysQ [Clostridia bacterium]
MNNIFKQNNLVTKQNREQRFGTKGAVVWLTGLSGSGKSTIAVKTEKLLTDKGYRCYLLDGDNLRLGLNADLGFSDEDRSENIRRISHVAALFAHSGCICFVSAISPFAKDRETAKQAAKKMDVPFFEIFVDTSVEECIRRDTKGLYKKALAEEIKDFTGISSPYEAPEEPFLRIDTLSCTADEAAEQVCNLLALVQNLGKMCAELCEVSIKAGAEILDVYNSDFAVQTKDDRSPLTQADLRSNKVIVDFLTSCYPDIAVLSEETKDTGERRQNPFCFVVDPLDGTKEFVKRNGEFTVNIGLCAYGKPILGVVYAPVTNTLWYAAVGCGAFSQTDDENTYFDEKNRIFVSDKTDNFTVMASRSHADERLAKILDNNKDRIAKTVSAGSSLKGCLIAEGKADIYYRTGLTCEWDTCAMHCVVEQAGGVLRQLDHTPLVYNRENTLNDKGFYILNRPENTLE